jgi:hypothetical protein
MKFATAFSYHNSNPEDCQIVSSHRRLRLRIVSGVSILVLRNRRKGLPATVTLDMDNGVTKWKNMLSLAIIISYDFIEKNFNLHLFYFVIIYFTNTDLEYSNTL